MYCGQHDYPSEILFVSCSNYNKNILKIINHGTEFNLYKSVSLILIAGSLRKSHTSKSFSLITPSLHIHTLTDFVLPTGDSLMTIK